jgi:hypothetical protein
VLCVVGLVHHKIWEIGVRIIVDGRRTDDLECHHDIRPIVDGESD